MNSDVLVTWNDNKYFPNEFRWGEFLEAKETERKVRAAKAARDAKENKKQASTKPTAKALKRKAKIDRYKGFKKKRMFRREGEDYGEFSSYEDMIKFGGPGK